MGQWLLLWIEIAECCALIVSSPTAVCYLIVALLLGGGMGAWFPPILGHSIGSDALGTYVFAVLSPLFADMLLDSEALLRTVSKDMRIVLLMISTIAGVLALVALVRDGGIVAWTCGAGGVVVSLFVWVLAMGKTGRFKTEDPQSVLGGATPSTQNVNGSGL
ncbi:hypothetical protein EOS_27355 [Caballeronia mineralivorans PML1(12)]|uniref:Uncharacterized protein n=1 Tax=Caballeronia mineralivorans PML1(12) TaxID=908627 RepID=A0A0J1CQR6_9BURK|nr:hypothetical protein EOS_27355 [Caballeronia mineralivorans PML1(12)]